MPCRYCDVSFSIIKWKNKCQTCLCTFCTNCIIDKRCLACQRVLDSKLNQDELMKIKVKDLKIFSITRGYEVSTCKEKYELVNLIRGNAGLSTGCTGHVTPVAPTPAPDSIRIYPSSNNVPEPPNYRLTQDLFPTADEYLNISTASYVNESVPSQTPPVVPPTAEASAKKTEENTSSNTASSSDAVSLPKATGRGGKLLLTDIQFVAQIKLLSPRQLKQILADNFVDYKGCVEKTELLKKVADLYEDVQKNNARQAEEESRALQSNPDEDSTCRICWDKPIDCVLLECGHMTTCTNCAKPNQFRQMSFLSQIETFNSGSLVKTEVRVKTCEGKIFVEQFNSGKYSSTPVDGDYTGWVVDLKPDLQMAEIRTCLYFGSQDVAKSLHLLEQKGITHILNVAYGIENCFPEKFIYRTLPLLDVPETDILSLFQTTNDFIKTSLTSGGKIYVHCNAGVSRCPTVVAAYLMKTENLKANEILQQMKEVRPAVCPNAGFLSQLHIYETCCKQ